MAEHSATDYYKRRERQEKNLAKAAPTPAVRDIHATLAEAYAQLAGTDGNSNTRVQCRIADR